MEPVVRTPIKFNPPVGGLKNLIQDQANWLSNNRLLILSDLFFIRFSKTCYITERERTVHRVIVSQGPAD